MKNFREFPKVVVPGQEVTAIITLPHGIYFEDGDVISAKAAKSGASLAYAKSAKITGSNVAEVVIASDKTAAMVLPTDTLTVELTLTTPGVTRIIPFIIGVADGVIGVTPTKGGVRIAFSLERSEVPSMYEEIHT